MLTKILPLGYNKDHGPAATITDGGSKETARTENEGPKETAWKNHDDEKHGPKGRVVCQPVAD